MRIKGNWETREIYIWRKHTAINNRELESWVKLSPGRSQRVFNHSPDGFAWGYGGSGPAQLALAILLEVTKKDVAVRFHQKFKWDYIARLPQADFDTTIDVEGWLLEKIENVPMARVEDDNQICL